jgi:hypothetical protein
MGDPPKYNNRGSGDIKNQRSHAAHLHTTFNFDCSAAAAIPVTAAGGFFAGKKAFQYGPRAPYSGMHFHSVKRTVLHARPALHAFVLIDNMGFSVLQFEYPMGAYVRAHPASGAFILIEF